MSDTSAKAVRAARDAKAKRLATKHSQPNQPGAMKSRGFDKTLRRRMNGQVEKRS
jgi:ribosomal protein L27